jgi:hypothetical protein
MLTQFCTGPDKIATHVGKEFGGIGGHMAAQVVHSQEEPVGDRPEAPTSVEATPGTVQMIKWKYEYEKYKKRHQMDQGNKPLPF